MTVRPIAKGGAPRAQAVCDDCGREETVSCHYVRDNRSRARHPDEGQVREKVASLGWTYVKGVLRCASCEAKRKVVNMTEAKKKTDEPAPPREPTPRQKREIIKLLEEVIDEDALRYVAGESDDTVAAALEVMPGWVAQLREEMFGATGDSNDMDEVLERARAMLLEEAEQKKVIAGYSIMQRKREEQLAKLISDAEAIKKTQGKRVMMKAGVR